MKYVLITLLTLVLSPIVNAENQYDFNNAKDEKLFRELTAELRCPKCQNQNIADSDAIVAKDLRNKVFELVEQGNIKIRSLLNIWLTAMATLSIIIRH